jgi:hypothetical protein
VDVDQVAAEPEQLRHRQDVPGVRGGGDLRERGPLQRGDLGSGRRVFEQQHALGGAESFGDAFDPDEEADLGDDVALPQQ